METASNENTLQSVDEHHPVDQQHPFEQQHPVEQEHPVDQQHLVDQEHSVDEVLSVDQEHSFDRERSVDQELSVDKEHSVEQEHLVDKEHSVEQEHLVDKEHSVEQEHLVDKEHSVDQEHLVDHNQDNMVADVSNHGVSEPNPDFNEEEVRCTLEAIASTGKFWHDWDKLKSMLSFQLKQVLSEYPESKMTTEQQTASIGETYPELLKKLDEALLSFVEGPPFTLQRLCEILLAARSIYPSLSKLALALEKNLSVTSTLTVCTDPYPQTPNEAEKPSEIQLQSNSVENGVEPIVEDRDEVMTEVEQGDIDDEMTIDMEALEEIVGSSETNARPTANS